MKTAVQTFAIALASVSAAAALGIGLADHAADRASAATPPQTKAAAAPVVVARLPRVVIVEHRRLPAPDMALAQAPAPRTPAL